MPIKTEKIPDELTMVSILELSELEDGIELFWIPQKIIYGPKKVRTITGKMKTQQVITEIQYPVYRCKLSKYHHKTVSGYLPCLVEDPSPEYPNLVPWASDWIYADRYIFKRRTT